MVATVYKSTEESEDTRYVGSITKSSKDDYSEYFAMLTVNGTQVKFKVDAGSQVNILQWDILQTVK